MSLRKPGRAAVLNAAMVGVLVTAAVGGYLVLHGGTDTAAASTTARTAPAAVGDVTATVSATGSSEPVSTTDVSFAASGTLRTLKVAVGQKVTKGQLLATLDTASLQRALDVAQLQLTAAQRQVTAAVDAYDTALAAQSSTTTTTTSATSGSPSGGQGSAQSVASADAQVAGAEASRLQAEAAVGDAQDALEAASLRSPVSGTVLSVNGSVGQSVSAGSGSGASGSGSSGSGPSGSGAGGGGAGTSGTSSSSSSSSGSALLTVADLTRMQLAASVSEADAMNVAVGQSASVVFNAAPEAAVTGRVTAVSPTPTTSNNVVSYAVTVSLADPPKGLRSGQTGTVTITTGSRSSVLSVPTSAVRTTAGRSTVTVVNGAQRQVTQVQVGLAGDQRTEITSGLTQGQEVLLSAVTGTSGGTGFPGGGFPGGGVGGGGLGGGGVGGGLGGGTRGAGGRG